MAGLGSGANLGATQPTNPKTAPSRIRTSPFFVPIPDTRNSRPNPATKKTLLSIQQQEPTQPEANPFALCSAQPRKRRISQVRGGLGQPYRLGRPRSNRRACSSPFESPNNMTEIPPKDTKNSSFMLAFSEAGLKITYKPQIIAAPMNAFPKILRHV